jgi:alanyl-tRNA synthetase
VADHLRTLCFAIADGAIPSNDGRCYVLPRVLRRAGRYGRQNLGAELGFFATLVPTVISVMGDMYPELKERQELVASIIVVGEEESFSKTLDKGIQ